MYALRKLKEYPVGIAYLEVIQDLYKALPSGNGCSLKLDNNYNLDVTNSSDYKNISFSKKIDKLRSVIASITQFDRNDTWYFVGDYHINPTNGKALHIMMDLLKLKLEKEKNISVY